MIHFLLLEQISKLNHVHKICCKNVFWKDIILRQTQKTFLPSLFIQIPFSLLIYYFVSIKKIVLFELQRYYLSNEIQLIILIECKKNRLLVIRNVMQTQPNHLYLNYEILMNECNWQWIWLFWFPIATSSNLLFQVKAFYKEQTDVCYFRMNFVKIQCDIPYYYICSQWLFRFEIKLIFCM